MSWTAYLYDDRGHCEGTWNYTHNTNDMIAEALSSLGCEHAFELHDDHPISRLIGPAWFDRLDGCDGPTGAKFLQEIADELDREPAKYNALNPSNRWGERTSLVQLFREMVGAVPEWPCSWSVSG